MAKGSSIRLTLVAALLYTDSLFYQAVKLGFVELANTLYSLREYREIAKFLFARMIYIDGLNTLFAFGGIYAAGSFGMATVMGFLLIGALLLMWVKPANRLKLQSL